MTFHNGQSIHINRKSALLFIWCLSICISLIGLSIISSSVTGQWDGFHGDQRRTGFSDSPFVAGDVLWITDLENGYIDTSPVISGDTVIVVTAGETGNDAAIHGLERFTGTEMWNTSLPGKTYQLSSPAIHEGRIYVGSSSGVLYCIDDSDGGIVWQRLKDSSPEGITSSPVFDVSGGTLYVSSGDGQLLNVDPADGSTIWSFDSGSDIYFTSPAILDDSIIIGTDDGSIIMVKDGASLWTYLAGDQIRSTPAISSNGTIFFTCEDGLLRSLAQNGELNWEAEIGRSISSPALSSEHVVVGSDTGLYCFSHTGDPIFHIEASSPVESSPAISDHQILFATSGPPGDFFSLDMGGNIQWSHQLNNQILSSPSLEDTQAIIASDSSQVWCFYSTPPNDMNITLDEIKDLKEGSSRLEISGKVFYDTGRPASGASVQIIIDDRSNGSIVSPNGSFLVSLSIELPSGNHSGIVNCQDGEMETSKTFSVTVPTASSSGGEGGEDFIHGFYAFDVCIVLTLVAFISRFGSGCFDKFAE